MSKKLDKVRLDTAIRELRSEELKLFYSYNRHSSPAIKLDVLSKLSQVINKIDALETFSQ